MCGRHGTAPPYLQSQKGRPQQTILCRMRHSGGNPYLMTHVTKSRFSWNLHITNKPIRAIIELFSHVGALETLGSQGRSLISTPSR